MINLLYSYCSVKIHMIFFNINKLVVFRGTVWYFIQNMLRIIIIDSYNLFLILLTDLIMTDKHRIDSDNGIEFSDVNLFEKHLTLEGCLFTTKNKICQFFK